MFIPSRPNFLTLLTSEDYHLGPKLNNYKSAIQTGDLFSYLFEAARLHCYTAYNEYIAFPGTLPPRVHCLPDTKRWVYNRKCCTCNGGQGERQRLTCCNIVRNTTLPGHAVSIYSASAPKFHLHLYAGALRVSVRIRPRSCFCWLKTIT